LVGSAPKFKIKSDVRDSNLLGGESYGEAK